MNYAGALFREFPAPWQVMLRQDNGRYVCVAEDKQRYPLGVVKQTLMQAMGLDTDKKGSALAFFRTGYRVCFQPAANAQKLLCTTPSVWHCSGCRCSRHLLCICKPFALLQSAMRLRTAGISGSDAYQCIAPLGTALAI